MQNRRVFLKHTSLVLAGGLMAPQFLSSAVVPAASGKIMGFQLYSLRDLVNSSGIQAALEAVSKIACPAFFGPAIHHRNLNETTLDKYLSLLEFKTSLHGIPGIGSHKYLEFARFGTPHPLAVVKR